MPTKHLDRVGWTKTRRLVYFQHDALFQATCAHRIHFHTFFPPTKSTLVVMQRDTQGHAKILHAYRTGIIPASRAFS